jgi:Glycosyltransferase
MNTVLIYNAFDIGKFQFEREELERFKVRNGLTGRPVIYIGNCRNEKGARTVWNALRDQRYQLVSSGISNIDLPIRKFLLPYREYLLLLAASSVVVTLSEFEEGWNRTAHEALLCRTPVIGSGSGGMGELLQNGGQLICQNQAALSSMVDSALEQRADLSDKGFAFAREFTIERFRHQWIELIASLN